MPWVKLDDAFFDNRKVANVGGDAQLLYIAGLCHANRNATDGAIPKGALVRLTDRRWPRKLATVLVDAGLWSDEDTFYEIHDYHDYQPSKEKLDEQRSKKADAGRKGGTRSKPPTKPEAKPKQNRSKPEAPPQAEPKHPPKQTGSPVPVTPEVQDQKLSAETPPQSQAKSVVDAWFERRNPKPAVSWIGARKLVERLLTAGWTPAQVANALDEAPATTLPALEFALRGGRNGTQRPSVVERSWNNINSAFDAVKGGMANGMERVTDEDIPSRTGNELASGTEST